MPKVDLKTLQKDVIEAALDVWLETAVECDGLPLEGSSIKVTEKDLRLWRAAKRLNDWKHRDRARPTKKVVK